MALVRNWQCCTSRRKALSSTRPPLLLLRMAGSTLSETTGDFSNTGSQVVADRECCRKQLPSVRELAQSAQLRDMRTAPAVALRNKNAEGWYVLIGRRVLAFTTEYETQPPREIVDLFHELESVAPPEKELRTVNDICMGSCYDPLAGLGLENMNDRCSERNGTRCK